MGAVVTRKQWGAKPPKTNPTARRRTVAMVLHQTTGQVTEATDELAMMRGVQRFHQDTRGWSDIAYSWLVSSHDGAVYEGRGWDAVGAHTAGWNSKAVGVCILGNGTAGDPDGPPSAACFASLRTLYYLAVAKWGAIDRLGHRDVASTSCPGDYAYSWWKSGRLVVAQAPGVAKPPKPAPVVPPRQPEVVAKLVTLKQGSKGKTVAAWQRIVGVAADGVFGPRTEAATIAWQLAHKLAGDGIVGPKTWAAAKAAGAVR